MKKVGYELTCEKDELIKIWWRVYQKKVTSWLRGELTRCTFHISGQGKMIYFRQTFVCTWNVKKCENQNVFFFLCRLIPFSVGKRRCPGEDFAMSRLFLLMTSMLQKIEFTPPVGEELPSEDPRLYTNKYPLQLPVFKCRALPRETIWDKYWYSSPRSYEWLSDAKFRKGK